MIRCPPSNTLASSIFLSPERVTLSPACVHTLLSPPPSTSLHLPLPPNNTTQGRAWPAASMALRGTKTHAASSKASFIRDEQKDGFTSALFPPLGPGLLVPLLLTAPLGPFSAGQRGCELRPLCSHVSVLVYSVRLCPLSQKTCKEIDQQLLTLPPLPSPQFRYEKHTCTFMCAGFTVNAGGAVCSSLTLGGGKVWNYAWIVVEMGTICLEYVVWPGSNPPRPPGLVENIFFFLFSPTLYVSQCFDIMSKLYVLLSNIWEHHSINGI